MGMDDPRAAVHSLTRRAKDKNRLWPAGEGRARPCRQIHAARRSFPRHPGGLPRPDHGQCRDFAAPGFERFPLGGSLHQLRVAFRRLEVRWVLSARNSARTGSRNCAARAKILLGRLSPARDLDVFTGKLLCLRPSRASAMACPSWRAVPRTARDTAWLAAQAASPAPIFEIFTDDVAALAGSQLPLTRDHKLRAPPAASSIVQVRRVKKARQGGQEPQRGRSPSSPHCAEEVALHGGILCPLYPRRAASHYLKELRGLLNHLAGSHDVANVRSVVGGLLA